MDSILTSIKKLLGITESYTHFDADLIIHINSVFSILLQLGVGPSTGFAIQGESETWNSFVADASKIELIKSYVGMKVKLLFDPPPTGPATEALNRIISEFEWRILAAADPNLNNG